MFFVWAFGCACFASHQPAQPSPFCALLRLLMSVAEGVMPDLEFASLPRTYSDQEVTVISDPSQLSFLNTPYNDGSSLGGASSSDDEEEEIVRARRRGHRS